MKAFLKGMENHYQSDLQTLQHKLTIFEHKALQADNCFLLIIYNNN